MSSVTPLFYKRLELDNLLSVITLTKNDIESIKSRISDIEKISILIDTTEERHELDDLIQKLEKLQADYIMVKKNINVLCRNR